MKMGGKARRRCRAVPSRPPPRTSWAWSPPPTRTQGSDDQRERIAREAGGREPMKLDHWQIIFNGYRLARGLLDQWLPSEAQDAAGRTQAQVGRAGLQQLQQQLLARRGGLRAELGAPIAPRRWRTRSALHLSRGRARSSPPGRGWSRPSGRSSSTGSSARREAATSSMSWPTTAEPARRLAPHPRAAALLPDRGLHRPLPRKHGQAARVQAAAGGPDHPPAPSPPPRRLAVKKEARPLLYEFPLRYYAIAGLSVLGLQGLLWWLSH